MNLNELTRTLPIEPNAMNVINSYYQKIPSFPNDIDKKNDAIDFEADQELVQQMAMIGWCESTTVGWYSTVFSKPGENYVLKVNKREDHPYAWFAFLTRKFPNPHFPKIGNAKFINIGKERYRVYAIEKLQPFKEHWDARSIAAFCKVTVTEKEDLQTTLKYAKRFDLGDQEESLITACDILRKYNQGYYVDIHTNNIMLRGETIVIIDPFSEE
jgi:hypothetical protein